MRLSVRLRVAGACAVLAGLCGAASAAGLPVGSFAEALDRWNHGQRKEACQAMRPMAEAGDVRAQLMLGLALLEGKDVPRDLPRGFAWLKIAAAEDAYGYASGARATARERLAALENAMSGADLIAADRIAGTYLQDHATDYSERMRAAAYVLTGRSGGAVITTAPGCALDRSIAGCDRARQIADWSHSCAVDIMSPDLPASTEGPGVWVVQPQFPAAVAAREGIVLTLVHVDTSGYVCQVALVRGSGSKDVDQAVLDSVRTWRFQPGLKGGTAVESLTEARIEKLVPLPVAAATPQPKP